MSEIKVAIEGVEHDWWCCLNSIMQGCDGVYECTCEAMKEKMKTYEQQYDELSEATLGQTPSSPAHWKLLRFIADNQSRVMDLVEAIRVLAEARKANPNVVRLNDQEQAVYRALKELDGLGK